MIGRRLAVAGAAVLALVLLGGQGGWLSAARTIAAIAPLAPLARLVDGSAALATGNDGRLTVLLLGSDARGGGIERTDAITIVSLKGKSITAVSIPRDMSRIPLPGGGTHQGKINAMVGEYAQSRGVDGALVEFEKVIEHFLAIEIDYHALIKFGGFDELVGEIEPITLTVRKEVRDSKLHDDPNRPPGVYFPGLSGYELYQSNPSGPPRCNGYWQEQANPIPAEYWCHRALMFARTRKGPNNSDFARGQRHQDIVIAAIKRVIERGSGDKLDSLRAAVNQQIDAKELYTNIPVSPANALELFGDLDGAQLDFATVFRPPTYASSVPGSTAFQPKVDAIRAYTKEHMGGSGAPAPPTSTATPTSRPTPTKAPTPTATSGTTATAGATATATAASTTGPAAPTAESTPTASPNASVTATASASPGQAGGSPSQTSSPTAIGGVVATDPATPAATGGGAVAAPSDTSGVPAIVWLAVLLGGLAAGGLLALRVWLKRLR